MKLILFIIVLAVSAACCFLWGAVSVAAANSWVFHRTFAEGWHLAFVHKGNTFLWGLVFGGGLHAASR